jgi:hypothetical protein
MRLPVTTIGVVPSAAAMLCAASCADAVLDIASAVSAVPMVNPVSRTFGFAEGCMANPLLSDRLQAKNACPDTLW